MAAKKNKSIQARYRAVFGSADGREVLKDLMKHLGHGQRLWAVDARAEHANVVRHDVALFIEERINGKDGTNEEADH